MAFWQPFFGRSYLFENVTVNLYINRQEDACHIMAYTRHRAKNGVALRARSTVHWTTSLDAMPMTNYDWVGLGIF